jgi:hypothetical protein
LARMFNAGTGRTRKDFVSPFVPPDIRSTSVWRFGFNHGVAALAARGKVGSLTVAAP